MGSRSNRMNDAKACNNSVGAGFRSSLRSLPHPVFAVGSIAIPAATIGAPSVALKPELGKTMFISYSQRRLAKQPHRRCSGSPMGTICRQTSVLDMSNVLGAGFPNLLDPCILVPAFPAAAHRCLFVAGLVIAVTFQQTACARILDAFKSYTYAIASSKRDSTRGKGQTTHDLEEGLKRGLQSRKSMTQGERMLAAAAAT
eukprot:1160587-Pelagomonas_calceolata.AAC.2